MYKWQYWDISSIDIEQYNIRNLQPNLKDKFDNSIQGYYYQGVESAYQYAYDVLTKKRKAGRAEIASCERFIHDLNRDDLYFDLDIVELCLTISNALKHPKGELMGQQFLLMPFMIFIISQMFGFFYNGNARESLIGSRRFTNTLWAVARGNSKTVIAASATIINMLLNENGRPVATCSAPVNKQSRLSFEDIKEFIRTSEPWLKKRFVVMANVIKVPSNGGTIIYTSKAAGTLDGFRIAGLALVDELHEHPDDSIVQVLSTGQGSSKDPQMFMISTAGNDTQSYCRREFDKAEMVAMNQIKLDRYLSIIYKVDNEDESTWAGEDNWIKANPALYHAVSIEKLRGERDEALLNASAAAAFKTKRLNIFVDFEEDTAFNSSDLMKCKDTQLNDISKYEGRDCYLGLDLAGNYDLSSLVYIFPNEDSGVEVFQKSYFPEGTYNSLPPSVKSRYYEASNRGELILTLTDVTDIEYIKLDIVNAYKRFNVLGFSMDVASGGAQLSHELINEHNIEAVAVRQGYGLSESIILMQRLIKMHKLKHNSDILEWCCVNARIQEGTSGDIRMIRPKGDKVTKKIDACIATVIGLSQTILQENQNSIYEHQEVRFL